MKNLYTEIEELNEKYGKWIDTAEDEKYFDSVFKAAILLHLKAIKLEKSLSKIEGKETKNYIDILERIKKDTLGYFEDMVSFDNFSAPKSLNVLRKFGNNDLLRTIKGLLPPGIEGAKKNIEAIRKSSTKLPKKKLKLENSINKFIKEINEEWFKTYKIYGETIEIFVNPNAKDIKDLKKDEVHYVRFLIDLNEKKVYVWDGDILHKEASKQIHKPYRKEGTPGYLWGAGNIVKDKIKFTDTSVDTATKKDRNDIEGKKYTDWLGEYFTNL